MSEQTKSQAFRAKIVQLGGETLAREFDAVIEEKDGGIFPPGKPPQPPVDPASKSSTEKTDPVDPAPVDEDLPQSPGPIPSDEEE